MKKSLRSLAIVQPYKGPCPPALLEYESRLKTRLRVIQKPPLGREPRAWARLYRHPVAPPPISGDPRPWLAGLLAPSLRMWPPPPPLCGAVPLEECFLGEYLGLLPLLLAVLFGNPGGSGTPVRAGAGAGMWLWEEQEGLLGPFSFILLLLLLVTRSPFNACIFTVSLYLLLRLFSFEPLPSRRALQVLKPRDRVSAIAHRGGSHDAPENTLAAIRQVSPPPPSPRAPPGSLDLRLSFRRLPSPLLIVFPVACSSRKALKWPSIPLKSGKAPDFKYS